ncbi:hypothetical protein JANAI62_26010 [Jannaschia pagri]|uniref:Uncharacterized protein n=1 Tax=Jannaschia pagri TaxID=2829797 RepID=A0ABQ4NNI9_9RHOB|nr:hypothetical protein JANAI61_26010 [Jannaschia sp. AI_61]GIT95978.1 hypothetical protein JANAI62_26010 [Jannaschia sp. AI_62]
MDPGKSQMQRGPKGSDVNAGERFRNRAGIRLQAKRNGVTSGACPPRLL